MQVIPLFFSFLNMTPATPNTQNAIKRLELIKSQLNLTPSLMSIEAPKDMAKERAAASFDIQALSYLWIGSEDLYKSRVTKMYPKKERKINFFIAKSI